MFMRLSLLPLEMVENGINALINFIETDTALVNDFELFIDYFQRTWMQRYPIAEWCVSECRYRTNNSLEGYNGKIKHFIDLNPTPWLFLEGLQDLAFDADTEFENARTRALVTVDQDNSRLTPTLQRLLPQLRNGEIGELEFLRTMARVGFMPDIDD